MVYYNENDPFAAAWLRQLIVENLIAKGEVDERSIVDVTAGDVRGYSQCHFFAGIGGWSYALRLAGWPDDRECWTGSCPCQSFSVAGNRKGFDDHRHLWPHWHRLIKECAPPVVFGEQVEAAIRHGWLDLVSTQLEAEGYAVGSAVLGAASIGAPHIRKRLWFVAQSQFGRLEQLEASARKLPCLLDKEAESDECVLAVSGCGSSTGSLDDPTSSRYLGEIVGTEGEARDETWMRVSGAGCETGGMALSNGRDSSSEREQRSGEYGLEPTDGSPGPTNGLWRAADWILCLDGKWRPIEPGTFPLANGIPKRMGKLRGLGNAIVPQVAATFIEAFMSESPAK